MKEELTTEMHAELLESEMPRQELRIWSIFGAIKQGTTKSKACKQHGISVEEYDKTIAKLRYRK